MSHHISALTWFRFESGDLYFGEWLHLRLHLGRCETCRAQRDARQIIGEGREVGQRRVRRTMTVLSGVAVLGVSALTVLQRPARGVDELTPKGGASTFNLAKVRPTAVPLDEICAAGDVLQGELRTTKKYVLVIGASGASVQVLYPAGLTQSAEVGNGVLRMPNSWVVDSEPGLERFVALFSDTPLDAEETMLKVLRGEAVSGTEQIFRQCRKP
jgi:hypothetical protein